MALLDIAERLDGYVATALHFYDKIQTILMQNFKDGRFLYLCFRVVDLRVLERLLGRQAVSYTHLTLPTKA